jgi:RecA/RadA recombinase
MLNLACTGDPDVGFQGGLLSLIVGDSQSGKTFISLTCLAEASINPEFDEYRLIYDAPERGALMDIKRFFGQRVYERLEPPRVDKYGEPIYSELVEDLYYNAYDIFNGNRPAIYIEDSQDSLTSEAEIDKFLQHKTAARRREKGIAGKKPAGSYGDGKPRVHSANLRKLVGPLERSKSILLLIGQTRDSFGLFESKTYSGGRALKFYATMELWTSVVAKIERTYHGKKRELGVYCKVRVKKNRVTGRDRSVIIPILHSFGIDDVWSMCSYLVDEGIWEENNGTITVTGLGPAFNSKMESLIQRIEEDDQVDDLKALVTETWSDIEKALEVKRRSRYAI